MILTGVEAAERLQISLRMLNYYRETGRITPVHPVSGSGDRALYETAEVDRFGAVLKEVAELRERLAVLGFGHYGVPA